MKETIILKNFTMIDPVTGWSEVMQYSNKNAMTIANLVVTTWLIQYPWPIEIMYDQGGELLNHKF